MEQTVPIFPDVVDDVISLCRDGMAFYLYAADNVDDYNLQRLFKARADMRSRLLQQLQRQLSADSVQRAIASGRAEQLQQWYREAIEQISSYDNFIFIELLERHEAQTLQLLKHAVKRINDQQMSEYLAEMAAHMQMGHDRMHALKSQFQFEQQVSL
ncbi:DUF2383 domain-containing protein [Idiomarina xiamenensis]|uniref:DUF2383 domain-containing protein n=1 Tax=Idiomarina xiamenensis 10-D-4 TaxID=740709 RepID=K2KA93_9GAMM|nr:DUF2383 domain-containing protein [Idiomarina xiamenensis]EKE84703.1 hypothetical protein A10D4_03795 [Idiomarina xiamenensis 10-D-4]